MEFIDIEQKQVSPDYQAQRGQTVINYLSKEGLGNYAWDKIKDWIFFLYQDAKPTYLALKEYVDDNAFTNEEIGFAEYLHDFFYIAKACLGEKELGRRIEALKRVK